jgi:hypothetical protein
VFSPLAYVIAQEILFTEVEMELNKEGIGVEMVKYVDDIAIATNPKDVLKVYDKIAEVSLRYGMTLGMDVDKTAILHTQSARQIG